MSFIDGNCFRYYPIIRFLILDCNKYSQEGSSLAHCFFLRSKIRRKIFFSTVQFDVTNIFFLEFFADFTNFNEKQQGI